jgi:uncharacterized protein
MEYILSAPVIIKILVSLIVMLAADKFIRNLPISMALGIAVLAAWSGHSFTAAVSIAYNRIMSSDYIILIIMVFMLVWLSSQMRESRIMEDLVAALKTRLSGKMLLAVVPAVIGLIPMPGGALFSAPLVDNCDTDKNIDNELKSQINYWFRHVWEYWLPLYAGVILAVQITGLEIWQIAILNFPITVFSVTGGYFLFLRKLRIPTVKTEGIKKLPVITHLMPIIVIVLVYILISVFFPSVKTVSKYLPMGISILFSMIITQMRRPISGGKWVKILLSKKILDMVLIVAVIQIYGAFIQAQLPDGSFLIGQLRSELALSGIPPLILIMLLPFISGFATGIAIGFVGASFPIVISILGPEPALSDLLSAVAIAYASGHIGQLMSPVHICNIVTNRYFKTDLVKTTSKLIPACLFILAGAFFSSFCVNLIF